MGALTNRRVQSVESPNYLPCGHTKGLLEYDPSIVDGKVLPLTDRTCSCGYCGSTWKTVDLFPWMEN